MTFSYAVIAKGGIVLAADSQVTHTHLSELGEIIGTYENQRGKIRRLKNKAAFSMAGTGGFIDTLLTKAELAGIDSSKPFEDVVIGYQRVFRGELERNYQGSSPRNMEAVFLFCGYISENSQRVPQIVRLDSSGPTPFECSPVTGSGWAWSGAFLHGAAIYLQNRFYRKDLTLEQAKLLAYCIAAEVAEQDNTVGGPIEVEVITPSGSSPLTNIEKYEAARQRLARDIAHFLREFE